MKSVIPSATATSSSGSSSPPRSGVTPGATMKECPPSEAKDSSCYFPGCRKDANCSCEMCLASINATLDLIPMSSLTKLSACRPRTQKSTPVPVAFNPSFMSTPTSFTCASRRKLESPSPALKSTAKVPMQKPEKKKVKTGWGIKGKALRWIFGLILILAANFGFSRWVSISFRPELSADLVRYIGEKTQLEDGLKEKLGSVQRALRVFVGDKLSNCSDVTSNWEIIQDGLLVNFRCNLYKSSVEEVSLWGWPLHNAGVLASGFSSRSLTIVSGQVTEWSGGYSGYKIRKTNSSWVLGTWSASVVQSVPNTVILEYKRSSILDYRGILSAASDLLKNYLSESAKRMKHRFWYLVSSGVSWGRVQKGSSTTYVPT